MQRFSALSKIKELGWVDLALLIIVVVMGLTGGIATLVILSQILIKHPPLFPTQSLKAVPYTLCILDGDILHYTIEVEYKTATPDSPIIPVFYKNLFYRDGEKLLPVGTVENNFDFIVRVESQRLTIPVDVDLLVRLSVEGFEWPNGVYVFRDAAVNVGPENGASSYDVHFENVCR